ncbi:MAG: DNA-protecting protein DprA [Firmicutes bacterium]|nr:DNA-protecting protein DprA [Bacillota bacterium]
MGERLYWLAWQLLMPGQARRVWEIVGAAGGPRRAWEATAEALAHILGDRGRAAELAARRGAVDPVGALEHLEAGGLRVLTFADGDYPEQLRTIADPPPALFVRGTLPPGVYVAIVGTRRASPYGRSVAARLAAGVARAGLVVVSGMARGVDGAAHRGALEAGGRTVAVLGCGPDVVYPREHAGLREEIAASGALVTEFPPGTPPEPWHFPVRNRIISGLSRAVVVVEAGEKSGALITADLALEQGRDVLAVPGHITSPLSRGPNRLIKQGARLVEGPEDVLDELGVGAVGGVPEQRPPVPLLPPDEERLYGLLGPEPVPLDLLVARSGLTPQAAAAALVYLEMKGLARRLPGPAYLKREVEW